MDKLAEQLKNDAALIDVEISSQLDRRLAASLHGVTPELPDETTSAQRPAIFWWASSLTGIAAALVVLAIINSHSQVEDAPEPVAGVSSVATSSVETSRW